MKKNNLYRLDWVTYCEQEGLDPYQPEEVLRESLWEGVVTAMCTESCEVEPDGVCPHGCPSPLIPLGFV